MYSRWTEYCKEVFRIFLGRQNGHVQALIIAPILAVSFLGFVVRAASSAVDPTLAKNGVIVQLQQRLNEIQQRSDIPNSEETVPTEEQPIAQPIEQPIAQSLGQPTPEEKEDAAPSATVALLPPSGPEAPVLGPRQSVHLIKPDETFTTILKKERLPWRQFAAWINAAQKIYELRRLQINHALTLSYEHDQLGTPTLRTVAYSIDKRSSLVLEKDESGHIESRVETVPTTLVWRAVGGRITHSLGWAASKIGVPASIIDAVADMGWDLNLSYDLQPGDPFKIIFEEIQHDGQAVRHGKVLAAEIMNKGKKHLVFPLDAEEGMGFGQQFLRYPVQFTRISSVFNDARLHPIYKRRRPHLGVDFAAPPGTPVRAVAAGRVTYAGWRGDYGHFLKINHAGPYSSAYAHLRRIKKGVRAGTVVKRGQIIGHVGSSGAATGPHLHFEMHKNGRYINPLKAKVYTRKSDVRQKMAAAMPLDPQLAIMKKKLEEYLADLSVQGKSESRVYTPIPSIQTAARETADPHA